MNFQSIWDAEAARNNAQTAAPRQRFLKALTLSVVIHAVVLLYGHSLPQRQKVARPLMATLRAVESPAPPIAEDPVPLTQVQPPTQAQPPAPQPTPAVSRKILRRPATVEAPRQIQVPAQSPDPSPRETGSDAAKRPEAVPDAAAPLGSVPPAVPSPPSTGLDPNALRRYRLALASAARRFKVYPRLAQERGWVGTAEIRVTVFAGARAPLVQLAKSSGFAVLDDQAREMLERAVQSTALPDALHGEEFSEVLPVRFDLESE